MTDKAKQLGLIPGWYGNNCACQDLSCCGDECFRGDVQATLDYGFQSIKLDSCGCLKNMTRYAELFNQSGVCVMLENCHNGAPMVPTRTKRDGELDCPMNFFRSCGDISPFYGSVLSNLESVSKYNGHEKKKTGAIHSITCTKYYSYMIRLHAFIRYIARGMHIALFASSASCGRVVSVFLQ
jgi:hypothetical protein